MAGLDGVGEPDTEVRGVIAADQLRLFMDRILNLRAERKGISDDIKDVFAEARTCGFDPPTMRKLIPLMEMDRQERVEAEALLETYKAALNLG